jgi:hypothetical protein
MPFKLYILSLFLVLQSCSQNLSEEEITKKAQKLLDLEESTLMQEAQKTCDSIEAAKLKELRAEFEKNRSEILNNQ